MARRAQSQQRQALNRYKREVRKFNRQVRAHNARIRSNQQKLKREIARLNARSTGTRYVTYRTSTQVLQSSFTRIEQASEEERWLASDELFELAESEAAASAATYNRLMDAQDGEAITLAELQATSITHELSDINQDLDFRWRGARHALNPDNPDAARHFCTSAREILVTILDDNAPDADVLAWDEDLELTDHNQVRRRDKIRYMLAQSGQDVDELVDFVEHDIDNVMDLFKDFNPATHGPAGKYDLIELDAIKTRVEGAIKFLYTIVKFDA
jgi:hypothetical protein